MGFHYIGHVMPSVLEWVYLLDENFVTWIDKWITKRWEADERGVAVGERISVDCSLWRALKYIFKSFNFFVFNNKYLHYKPFNNLHQSTYSVQEEPMGDVLEPTVFLK